MSPPVSLGLYELRAGLFHGEGSVRVETQALVSRWVFGPDWAETERDGALMSDRNGSSSCVW